MKTTKETNVKEISYIVKTTFGAPLDVRYLLSTLKNIDIELPVETRYEGLIVFVQNISRFFKFVGGTSNANLIPFNQSDIISISRVSDIASIQPEIRYKGMCVWVDSESLMYIFDTGTTNADLHPHNQTDIKTIETLANVSAINKSSRFIGMCVWIKSLNRFFVFKTGIEDKDLEPNFQSDVIKIAKYEDIKLVNESNRFVGQIVYVEDEQLHYSFVGGIKDTDLIPFKSQSIRSISSLATINSIPVHARYVGQMIYVEDINQLMIFETAVANTNLKPINQIDVKTIDNVSNISSIQKDTRFIGQLVWVRSLSKLWIFKSGIEDANLLPFNQTDVVSIKTYATELGIQSIPMQQRFIGQMIYVEDEQHFYTFSGGITNENVIPLRDNSIVSIQTFESLSLEHTLPTRLRYIGQLVYVISEKLFYSFKTNINTLEPIISSNSVVISSLSKMDIELPMQQRFIGQMIYVHDIDMICIFSNTINNAEPLKASADIIKVQRVVDIKSIPQIKRFIGLLVFVKDISTFYVFKTGVGDSDCVTLYNLDIISVQSIKSTLSTVIPKDKRYVGQLVYAIDDDSYYYFKTGIEDINLLKLNQFDVKTVKTWNETSTIKRSQRFEGLIVYVSSIKTHFTYSGGIEDSNLIPLQGSAIISVDTFVDISKTSFERRYIGQIYYVRSLGMLFGYKSGITDSSIVSLNQTDILNVDTLAELEAVDTKKRFAGQLAYVQNTKTMYKCISQASVLSYVPFNQTDIISVTNKTDLDNLQQSQNFAGRMGYVTSEKTYYMYNGVGYEPLRTPTVVVITTYEEALKMPIHSRYIGQQIFVTYEKRMYTFKNSTQNIDLKPSDNSYLCSTLSKIDLEIPKTARQHGQYIWVDDIKQLRVFDFNLLPQRVRSEIQKVDSTSEMKNIGTDAEQRPYIVLNSETSKTMVWKDSSNRYININASAIIVGEKVASLLTSLSKIAADEERVIGQLYFIKTLGVHYTFVDGIEDSNFKPIEAHYIVPSIRDIETVIPPERRYVGMQFYVVDESLWYYFQDVNVYKKQQGFTQFQDTIFIDGDVEYVHDKNINSMILEIRNSDNEVVEMPHKQGYLSETGKTEAQILYGRRNILSISTDVSGMYTLYMLTL